jgi:hypothetical protein
LPSPLTGAGAIGTIISTGKSIGPRAAAWRFGGVASAAVAAGNGKSKMAALIKQAIALPMMVVSQIQES